MADKYGLSGGVMTQSQPGLMVDVNGGVNSYSDRVASRPSILTQRGGYTLFEQQVDNQHKKLQLRNFQPSGGKPSNSLNTTGQVSQFEISTDIDAILQSYVRVELLNNHATDTITLVPAPLLIQKVDVLLNGTSVGSWNGLSQMDLLMTMNTTEELTRLAAKSNITVATGAAANPIAAASATSAIYNIPLYTVLEMTRVPLCLFGKFAFRVVIYWASGASLVAGTSGAATAANVVFSNLTLAVQGYKYDEPIRSQFMDEISRTSKLTIRYLDASESATLPTLAVTAGQTYNAVIPLQGNYEAIFFHLVTSTAVGNALWQTATALTSIDLRNNSGQSYYGWGDQTVPVDLLVSTNARILPAAQVLATAPVYPLIYSDKIVKTIQYAEGTYGAATIVPSSQLYYIPASSVTGVMNYVALREAEISMYYATGNYDCIRS